ncbi:MAG: ABC transporter permease [Bryobacteraceae bacterium]|jgi:ABC-type polysaccharide/polyol phosphate export permease
MWSGDYRFVSACLVEKDFKVRYRNMSLGLFWSLLNPIVMMGVMTFVFTRVFANPNARDFPLSVLCGLVPFNFYSVSFLSGTTSLVDNSNMVKRVPVPREIIPITTVLGNCLHLLIQIGLLLTLVLVWGKGVSSSWLWLPVVWGFEIVFVCGLALIGSSVNVYVRDTRYVVESANMILFWLVPIFYSFSSIPARFREIYQLNPIAALVMALRNILLDHHAPAFSLLWRLAAISCGTLLVGILVFRRLQRQFYTYL